MLLVRVVVCRMFCGLPLGWLFAGFCELFVLFLFWVGFSSFVIGYLWVVCVVCGCLADFAIYVLVDVCFLEGLVVLSVMRVCLFFVSMLQFMIVCNIVRYMRFLFLSLLLWGVLLRLAGCVAC